MLREFRHGRKLAFKPKYWMRMLFPDCSRRNPAPRRFYWSGSFVPGTQHRGRGRHPAQRLLRTHRLLGRSLSAKGGDFSSGEIHCGPVLPAGACSANFSTVKICLLSLHMGCACCFLTARAATRPPAGFTGRAPSYQARSTAVGDAIRRRAF